MCTSGSDSFTDRLKAHKSFDVDDHRNLVRRDLGYDEVGKAGKKKRDRERIANLYANSSGSETQVDSSAVNALGAPAKGILG